MIRYLEQEEKIKSRALWNEGFPEDSECFTDYYYAEKICNNRILVKEAAGEIIAMLHLNPYRVKVKEQIWKLDYIVGVATSSAHRKKGHMRDLLNTMFQDLLKARIPFAFLMPADPKIYESFQFTYIFDQPQWKLKGTQVLRNDWNKDSNWSAEQLAGWINDWLAARYQVYSVRDRDYLDLWRKELASEDGVVQLLSDKQGTMIGLTADWGVEKRVQRTLLCDSRYIEEREAAKPAIMARIVNLVEFLQLIGFRHEGRERTVGLQITDPLLPENEGLFWWHLTHGTSWLERACSEPGKRLGTGCDGRNVPVLSMEINQLASWLFGYQKLEEILQVTEQSLIKTKDWKLFEQIAVLEGVYLDEIV